MQAPILMLLGTKIFKLIQTMLWMLLLKRFLDHIETVLFLLASLVSSVSAFIHVDCMFAINLANIICISAVGDARYILGNYW